MTYSFKILAHASMIVSGMNKKILIDPWFNGPAYWHSWWHFPEPRALNLDNIDYVFLTHFHEDHFHIKTLKNFPKTTNFIVPMFPNANLMPVLKEYGFNNITELKHGAKFIIEDDFELFCYQTSWNDDSALIIKIDDKLIANLNDAKLGDSTLKYISKIHGPIDFFLKSHSSATAYPDCFKSKDSNDLSLIDKNHYFKAFIKNASVLNSKYLIPFASHVCFLHEDTFKLNNNVINPYDLEKYLSGNKKIEAKVKIMIPGDCWSKDEGFKISKQIKPEDYDSEIKKLFFDKQKEIKQFDKKLIEENKLTFNDFNTYFSDYLRSIPWFIRKLIPFSVSFLFINNDKNKTYYILNYRKAEVSKTSTVPKNCSIIIKVNPSLLASAIKNRVYNFIDISKRLEISISAGKILHYGLFKESMNLYECVYLPISNLFNMRFMKVCYLRRRELFDYIKLIITKGIPHPDINK